MSDRRVDPAKEAAFWEGVAESGRFFEGDSALHRAVRKLATTLEAHGIAYAIAGAMALNAYGYRRATEDVDVLLTREGLAELKRRVLGLGYLERHPGSRGLRDTENGVNVDVLIAGDYPGDGLPKPVRFPDPALVAERGAHAALLPLPTLVELKLASGMSAPHRLKDLADVLELIRAASLPEAFGTRLDPSVREKFAELWQAAQGARDE